MAKMTKHFDRSTERSFTLVETMIALGMLASIILQISGVQGNSIYFSEYSQNVTNAVWLAKRVMSQVEYHWESQDFKSLETEVDDGRFEDFPDYSYALKIKDWKLPITSLLGGGNGSESEDSGSQMLSGVMDKVLGKELLKVAHVEVFWAEGAQRNSTEVTLLLTNQKKVDEVIGTFKALSQAQNNAGAGKPKTSSPNTKNATGEKDGDKANTNSNPSNEGEAEND